MKAAIYEGPGILTIKEVPQISPGPEEVRIRVKACGICGSDVHGYLGLTGRRTAPMIMGHEFTGVIEEAGEKVSSRQRGDRVAVYPVDFCGRCEMCQSGEAHLCLHKRAFGVLDVDGAFAETICVPAKCCFLLEDGVSFEVGALMEPLAVAYRGVGHAGDLEGKDVLIVGAGTIGLLTLACVRTRNPGRIFVSDLSDGRLQTAKEMGADIVVNPSRENLQEVILACTAGRGVDTALEAVGAKATVQQAMSALKFEGTAVWIGNNQPVIELNMQQIVTRELTVQGSFLYGYEEFSRVSALINEDKLHIEQVISLKTPLEKAPEYFHTLAHRPGSLIKVIIEP